MQGISGTSGSDIWAVGYTAFDLLHSHGLIEHYDGSAWTIVPSPNDPVHPGVELTSIATSSSTDAWAVGFDNGVAGGYYRTFALRWNGAAWTEVKTHRFSGYNSEWFSGISANPNNSSDVWAVGGATTSGFPPTNVIFAQHWDGQSWKMIVVSRGSTNQPILNGVATASTGGAWAVGTVKQHPLIEKITGTKSVEWPAAHRCCLLRSVSAIAPNDVWAVGEGPKGRPIFEHFDGSKWSAVPNPITIAGNVGLTSVNAVSSTDVWAAGSYYDSAISPNTTLTFIEHWDGSSWSIVPSDNEGVHNGLDGIYGFKNGAVAAGAFDATPDGLGGTLGTMESCNP